MLHTPVIICTNNHQDPHTVVSLFTEHDSDFGGARRGRRFGGVSTVQFDVITNDTTELEQRAYATLLVRKVEFDW
jgi:hypothetical protein